MNKPLVSIIIPTYNRAHLIRETLDSVLEQTYENWECIVVDDGSTDITEEVVGEYIKKDSRFQFHHRPADKPKGANACRNYGFEISKGEYVNWFDSDDLMEMNFITGRINFFDDCNHFVIGSGFYWNPDNDERKIIDLNLRTNLFKDYSLWKLPILTPSVLFRKSFLNDTELFNTKIKRGQEAELFSRLFYQVEASDYVLINKPLFLYRKHEESKSFKSNSYVESYKESQTYIALENFKKSAELRDLELLAFFNTILIGNFFAGIQKCHVSNSKYILKNYTRVLLKVNSRFAMVFYIIGCFFLLIGRRSHKAENGLKKYNIL